MNVLQRYHDWRHERRIQRHARSVKADLAAGDKIMARVHWGFFCAAINARSPQQVERMNHKIGVM